MNLRIAIAFSFFWMGYRCFSQAIDSLKVLALTEQVESKKPYQFRKLSYEYLSHQELDSCLKYAKLGKLAAIKNGDRRGEAYNLEMEGNIFYYLGLYEKGMNFFTSTLQTGEHLKDTGMVARSLAMMAWIYIAQRRFEKAIDKSAKALRLQKKIPTLTEDLALAYYCVASIYSYTHSPYRNMKLASSYYDSALAIMPGLRLRERAFLLAERGAIFKEEPADFLKCEEYLLKALQLVSTNTNHLDTKAYILSELSNCYARSHQTEKAKIYAMSAAEIYSKLPVNKRIPSVYQLLSETFEKIGDLKMTVQMERAYHVLSDSIFNYQSRFMVEQIHEQYEDEKKQAEIQRLKVFTKLSEEKEVSNRRRMWIIEMASFVIVVLSFVAFRNRNRYLRNIQALKIQQTLRDERDKISRDLHDSLGGQLSSISIGVNRLAHNGNGSSLQDIQELVDNALGELRNSLWVMDKEWISISELEERINGLYWQYRKIDVPISLQLKVEEVLSSLQLPSGKAGQLYRIIQESLHNSIKHSKATYFRISIEKIPEGIQFIISDDGVGFDKETTLDSEHHGLKNMKIRADQIKAEILLESTPGKGVKIILTLLVENQLIS